MDSWSQPLEAQPWSFPWQRGSHREGCELPMLPGWPPQDLGHQCSSPTLSLSPARVPVGFFLMHECLWEHLHVDTISYLHLWLFMKSQNCSEDREPQRCQDTLGEVVSSPLAAPSASLQRVPRGTWSGSSSTLSHKALRLPVPLAPALTVLCVLSPSPSGDCLIGCGRRPTPCMAGGAHHCSGPSVPRLQAGSLPGSTGALCSPPPVAQ